MKLLSFEKAIKHRRFLRINILLGLTAFAIGFFLIATGDFSSYAQSRADASLYNRIAIGGLLYAAFFWMYCMLSKPFWFPSRKKSSNN